jgi:cytochrome c oxidase assembly protein subunit 15
LRRVREAYIESPMSTSTATAARPKVAGRPVAADPHRAVRRWLYLVALMIVAMVVVGGATRLTNSGLSITEWKPIHGVIPPLNETEWQEEFAKYREIPEYQAINEGMSLAEFKGIFWWEWAHRLLGRLIGVVVLVPMIAFFAMRRIDRKLAPKVVAIFLLGGLQGAVGWWMVASGLAVRTDVSQYRLTIHLTLACAILAYVVWVARGLRPPARVPPRAARPLRTVGGVIVALVFLQIALGGLVAGLDAGFTFNTWPLMDGTLVPSGLFIQEPWWLNPFENVATVQFDHRIGAYVLFLVALFHAVQARGSAHAGKAAIVFATIVVQAVLGIATLVMVVPLHVALTHQFGAVVVLWLAVTHLRDMTEGAAVTGAAAIAQGPAGTGTATSARPLPGGQASG